MTVSKLTSREIIQKKIYVSWPSQSLDGFLNQVRKLELRNKRL